MHAKSASAVERRADRVDGEAPGELESQRPEVGDVDRAHQPSPFAAGASAVVVFASYFEGQLVST